MEAKDIANKARKVIQLHDDYIYNKVYFNPVFLKDFYADVPELKEAGIQVEYKETESQHGSVISGALIVDENTFDLGSVLLDGEDMVVKNRLVPVEKLIGFIQRQAEDIEQKSVQEKEESKPIQPPLPVKEPPKEKPEPKPQPKEEPVRVRPEPEKPKEPRERRKNIERV